MPDLFAHIPLDSMIIISFCLLCLSPFFSATEIAMFTFRKTRLAMLVKQNNKTAILINKIMQKPEALISTVLIGNNITNTGFSVLMTTLALAYFGEKGVLISMAVTTFLLIQFGEILPKVLASQYWEKAAFTCARPIQFFSYLFYPASVIFASFTRIVTYVFGIRIKYRKPFITKDELKHIVDISAEAGHLQVDEVALLQNIFRFADRRAGDVMIPRDKIVAVDIAAKPEEVMKIVTEKHYTRIPVYEDSIDHIIGILHTKDYFNVVCYQNLILMEDLLREPFFIAEDDKISDVLKSFQKNRLHLAVVRDKDEKVLGIVTIENIIEEIVGDIMDEHR